MKVEQSVIIAYLFTEGLFSQFVVVLMVFNRWLQLNTEERLLSGKKRFMGPPKNIPSTAFGSFSEQLGIHVQHQPILLNFAQFLRCFPYPTSLRILSLSPTHTNYSGSPAHLLALSDSPDCWPPLEFWPRPRLRPRSLPLWLMLLAQTPWLVQVQSQVPSQPNLTRLLVWRDWSTWVSWKVLTSSTWRSQSSKVLDLSRTHTWCQLTSDTVTSAAEVRVTKTTRLTGWRLRRTRLPDAGNVVLCTLPSTWVSQVTTTTRRTSFEAYSKSGCVAALKDKFRDCRRYCCTFGVRFLNRE